MTMRSLIGGPPEPLFLRALRGSSRPAAAAAGTASPVRVGAAGGFVVARTAPEPAGCGRRHARGRGPGLAVDQQAMRELALPEARLGGGHLAVNGKPDRRAVHRGDLGRRRPPGMIDAATGKGAGLYRSEVELPVAQARAVRARHPGRLVPAVAREV